MPDRPGNDSCSATLRLGTRGSLLARTQSQLVADAIGAAHPGVRVELTVIKTSGDQIAERPLHEFGGKGLFTKELEQALLAGQIDLAVHSFKDVPVTMPLVDTSDLVIAAVPERENPYDVLVSPSARRLADLSQGARVGTGSLRRRCQLLAARADLIVEGIRGNIDTRLRKLREGQFDAIVLAAAGVRRAGLFDASTMAVIDDPALLLPAPGQGALAIECRRDDARTREVLVPLNHAPTADCVAAERAVVLRLNGDCHSPIAAFATIDAGGQMTLHAAVGARDGAPPVIIAQRTGPAASAASLADAVFEDLSGQGVQAILAGGR
jgi:hydroxymethylbilane synthase